MSQSFALLERFKPTLRSSFTNYDFLLGHERGYNVYYIPFEFTNAAARLALVGITPGPTQMAKAYDIAQKALRANSSDIQVLRTTKQLCAFVGMRDKINEMLDHFNIPRHLGIASATNLWESDFQYLQPVSIIPNAAFKGSDCFNAPFSSVLDVPLLRQQFENVFIPSIEKLSEQTVYMAMGPIVDEALRWCATQGIVKERQLLGYFPHASGRSGSQVAYFLRKKQLTDLNTHDPVRHRARGLDAAYERISSNVRSIFPTIL